MRTARSRGGTLTAGASVGVQSTDGDCIEGFSGRQKAPVPLRGSQEPHGVGAQRVGVVKVICRDRRVALKSVVIPCADNNDDVVGVCEPVEEPGVRAHSPSKHSGRVTK